MNIGSLLPHHARYRPNHTAVVVEDSHMSFWEFNRRVNRLANVFSSLDVKKGDKVATILPNCLSLLETYWAVAKIGAVVVPLSPLLREKAVATLIQDSDAGTIIASPDFAGPLASVRRELQNVPDERFILTGLSRVPDFQSYDELTLRASEGEPPRAEIVDNDPYNIIYSSGTTGSPRESFSRTTYAPSTARFLLRPFA